MCQIFCCSIIQGVGFTNHQRNVRSRVSVSNLQVSVLVSAFMTKSRSRSRPEIWARSRSRRLRSRLHHCRGLQGKENRLQIMTMRVRVPANRIMQQMYCQLFSKVSPTGNYGPTAHFYWQLLKCREGGVKRAPFFLFTVNQNVNKLLPRSLVSTKLVTPETYLHNYNKIRKEIKTQDIEKVFLAMSPVCPVPLRKRDTNVAFYPTGRKVLINCFCTNF